ncbi:hypothetical protein [Streptomyces sp. ISL-94]|nr:hypothetical protein [Streptomyces sp. ISL-94]
MTGPPPTCTLAALTDTYDAVGPRPTPTPPCAPPEEGRRTRLP